ncbi:alpha-(1,3)-fucosyltransferase C-like [Argopecten irradians]|uniref:alpha-(1,3)-fucosyltransferase C-like n=1 Tax=Argopecten irradians TaxID=31199 RepID=UPI00371CBCEE
MTLSVRQSRFIKPGVCLLSLLVLSLVHFKLESSPSMHPYVIPKTNELSMTVYSNLTEHSRRPQSGFSEYTSTKTILMFSATRWFNEWVGTKWNSTDVFRTCPVQNCMLTQDRTLKDSADVVMFRWNDLTKCRKKLKDGQIWILFEHESPVYSKKSYKRCNDKKINWTCTYRRDSDFTLVHGHFAQKDTEYNISQIHKLWTSKSKTAIGFISHCKSPSKRDQFVEKLRSYGVDIDIFGKCGKGRCGSRATNWLKVWNITKDRRENCFDVLDTRYKFYLSLENALCKDYVTEKSLHLVLSHQIIPLIRDGANRSIFHPPNSYIDTKDFKSIKAIAEHIKYLSKNFDRYLEYFHWRNHYSVETITSVLQSIVCDVCRRVHLGKKYQRLYNNLNDFYTKSHEKKGDKHICESKLI